MSAFPLTSELTVNIFRTEPHLCDAAGLLAPLWGQTNSALTQTTMRQRFGRRISKENDVNRLTVRVPLAPDLCV